MSDWRVIVGYEAQRDLWTFGWDPDLECGGVVMGRFETDGLHRYDDGRSLFIRRIVRSDRDATPTAVRIDYDALIRKQSIQSIPGHPGGSLTGAEDYGVIVGSIHSHPGIDRQR